jgi:hypothetical protein
LKLPVATSTTPPRLPPSLPLPHQRIRGSDDRRAHPSRARNRTRQDFSYLFGPAESFSRGRGTSTPTSSIAGERRAGGARLAACPARSCGVGENLSPRRCRWAELLIVLGFNGPGPVSHGMILSAVQVPTGTQSAIQLPTGALWCPDAILPGVGYVPRTYRAVSRRQVSCRFTIC